MAAFKIPMIKKYVQVQCRKEGKNKIILYLRPTILSGAKDMKMISYI